MMQSNVCHSVYKLNEQHMICPLSRLVSRKRISSSYLRTFFIMNTSREQWERKVFFLYISTRYMIRLLIDWIYIRFLFFSVCCIYIYIYTYINPISLVLFNNGIDNQLNYMFNIRIVFLSSHRRTRYVDNWWFCLRKWRFFSSSLHTGCL